MTGEPNLNVNVELDLNGADQALDDLTRKADAFGGALSGPIISSTLTKPLASSKARWFHHGGG